MGQILSSFNIRGGDAIVPDLGFDIESKLNNNKITYLYWFFIIKIITMRHERALIEKENSF